MKSRIIAFLIVIILMTIGGFVYAQGNTPRTVTIFDPDASSFPTVRFTVRVQDESGQAISGLGASNFTLSESYNDPLSVTESRGTISTIFIFNSHPNAIKEQELYEDIVREFGNIAFQPGDSLAYTFTAFDNIIEATSTAQIVEALRKHTFSMEGSVTSAIDRAMAYLTPAHQANQQVQVILIGSYMKGDIKKNNSNIPLHVIHAGTRTQYEDIFRSIANGQFLSLQQPDVNLTNFLAQINNNHILYKIEYGSRTAQERIRSVTVTVNANGGSATGLLNYQADVLPPSIDVTSSSSDHVINRTAEMIATPSAITDAQYQFDQNTETLTVHIQFPDGRTRSIEQAWLVIDGVPQPSITPAINNGSFTIQWDLNSYAVSKTVGVAVAIQDYFGLQTTSPTMSFEIIVPEFVSPTVELNPCINLDGSQKSSAECTVSENATATLVILGVQILIVIILIIFLIWQHRRIGRVAGEGIRAVTGVANKAADGARKTTIAFTNFVSGKETRIEDGTDYTNIKGQSNFSTPYNSSADTTIEGKPSGQTVIEGGGASSVDVPNDALAIFVVEKGQAVHGKQIIMNETMNQISFGREEAYGVDSEALINMDGVSRRHCTIFYNHNTHQFIIQDEDSANGTYVEGERLSSKRETPLKPGDQIRLGKSFAMRFIPHAKLVETAGVTKIEMNDPFPKTGSVQLIDDYDEIPDKSDARFKSVSPNEAARVEIPKPINNTMDDGEWLD